MAVLLNVDERGYELGDNRIGLVCLWSVRRFILFANNLSVPALDLGVHDLAHDIQAHYVCVIVDTLTDYNPLALYKLFYLDVIALHHCVFSGEA